MYKLLFGAMLLATSFSAQSSVTLNTGESFFSPFSLISQGDGFKETDFFWDLGAQINFAGPSAGATLTAYEDLAGTEQVFTSPFSFLFSGGRSFLGSNNALFEDLNGSFRITNTGANSIELVDVIVSNFAGDVAPSFVATATITPSAVPLPAALWLFLPALLGVFGLGRKRI